MRDALLRSLVLLVASSLLPACAGSVTSATGGGADGGPDAPTLHGTFACGPNTCDLATEACITSTIDGAMPLQSWTTCQPLPAACVADHTCACVESMSAASWSMCTDESDGSISASVLLP